MASVLQRARDYTTSASYPSTTSSSYAQSDAQPTEASPRSMLATTLVIIGALLVLEQTVYRLKKKHLPGAKWTIPIIGKFADSLSPTLEGYKRQWDSGALSVVSVFNMCVLSVSSGVLVAHSHLVHRFIVIASSNEYARKIMNSPTFTEPCLVASAKQVLLKENW
jgi:C-22 sterol desaturase